MDNGVRLGGILLAVGLSIIVVQLITFPGMLFGGCTEVAVPEGQGQGVGMIGLEDGKERAECWYVNSTRQGLATFSATLRLETVWTGMQSGSGPREGFSLPHDLDGAVVTALAVFLLLVTVVLVAFLLLVTALRVGDPRMAKDTITTGRTERVGEITDQFGANEVVLDEGPKSLTEVRDLLDDGDSQVFEVEYDNPWRRSVRPCQFFVPGLPGVDHGDDLVLLDDLTVLQ